AAGGDAGTGTSGGLVVDPTFLDLGQMTPSGTPALSADFDLKNTNASVVTITVSGFNKPATPSCSHFNIDPHGPLPQFVGPMTMVTWTASFGAMVPGQYTCHVDILDNDGDPDFIDLYAEVIAPVMVVSPLDIPFGDVMVGNSSTLFYSIQNNGTANLTIN